MGKRKSWEKRDRVKIGDQKLLDNIQSDLDTLEVLAQAFDQGRHRVATTMSAVIINIVGVKNKAASQARGNLVFPTPGRKMDQRNLTSSHRLVSMEVWSQPATVKFVPWFASEADDEIDNQSFRTWWETEPIYVAGAGRPDAPLGTIPLNPEDQVAWDDREKLTRHQLCTDMRNTVGAHTDGELTAILNDIYDPRSFGSGYMAELPDGTIVTTDDGTIPVVVAPAEAAVRQIAHEVLMAYGRHGYLPTTEE